MEHPRLLPPGLRKGCDQNERDDKVDIGDARVSIEVFADFDTTAEQMLAHGREMFSWIPNAYIKYPCTHEGLRAAQASVSQAIRVNMTLCFSQEQAAAVYAATRGSKEPVYVSPFLGRLDDRGENGMDLVRNIKKMYEAGDGRVRVLAASIRHLRHLLGAFALDVELATAPSKVWEEWAAASFPLPGEDFEYEGTDKNGDRLRSIPYNQSICIDNGRVSTSITISPQKVFNNLSPITEAR
jgi:transaldolase